MGLLDATEYDPRPAQRRNRIILTAVVVVIVAVCVWFFFRYWPEEHVINQFFQAIESKNFEAAYGIYNHDPDWKQHPNKYKDYTLSQFVLDWGPSSEYGPITSHKIDCATEPHKSNFQSPSGVIVVVIINNRAEPTSLWVEKKDKTITTSPIKAVCR
jgi:hypothetical protein